MTVCRVALPNGPQVEMPPGTTWAQALNKLNPNLVSSAIAVKVGEQLLDLNRTVPEGEHVLLPLKLNVPEGMEILRHSTAHLMAAAVKEMYPDTKVTIGPAIADGFYYDFDRAQPFTPEDLQAIEEKMVALSGQRLPFLRQEVSKAEARRIFTESGETYKLELLDAIADDQVSLYTLGRFLDLCRGPHLPHSGWMKAFKLLSVAGAYWRGDERNKMLQRIYGTSFDQKASLEAYLKRLEEAKRRDHRRLGKELDLFSLHEDAGAGLVYWHPKGALMRKIIEDFWRDEHLRNGYDLLFTPHIGKAHLWETSGHLGFYKENMYSPMAIDEEEYYLKPMNCPFHIKIYKTRQHSYRQLPIRWAELGTVYRYEKSGVLHGLFRVRGFTQDDAHIFCRRDQLEEEIKEVFRFVLFVLKTFGFSEYQVFLSTKPKEGAVGTDEGWEEATEALRKALQASQLAYEVDEGGGAFYGPKVDIKIKDSLERTWQCSTIQVDFNEPERFDMTYAGEDGKEHQPIMIHRALMGSLERFFGVLVEHYGGAFPVWLAPVQARILTIADRHIPYAQEITGQLRAAGLRVDADVRSEKINGKIRDAQLEKIPYMLVVGDREIEQKAAAVRVRTGENRGAMPLAEIIQLIQNKRDAKTTDL
jgi:threonyl-tRNA synthetase